ncbi:arsenic-transporting ATPase [bacterium (Candidatus Blackallbacteria) CG17_big_fil_post_rev_8_21_14_2_50_48_46]|uniref:arsenite-transporting ATPase n=1 Tax=bacterium (Candidatus Blackallbacteria) CG17_big_fil_post_rev_8_21_14_2_50_48_46 TaxID=2014261 RepID=A0A2M7G3S7_9BACT|nr:MAG: arsenic-transporting ATPase [bacterium (Candidatus Blackallbacteria) CG18_big_fil_WC_8_21_14_2_50_49_26]PIW16515.1 MAG: arsenic-transporting ATPase [bacterium (Candidatus Blackallbacteria) CG17_big_fil_post_rev_8_21_14_2_50_48_46]PIW46023.1 MAG: arsenic-transporting ATPase [bacterium (Candidatus Blackallbacteria) CG13_big_fil_rev_8_21_14_2_50_49_14]
MRIILYTGKGGVGKTTLSAATALKAAQMGYRTLIISTDPAHSLSDSFDLQLSDEPTSIRENLWGQEINVLKDIHKYWGELQASLSALLVTKGFDNVVADELAVMPGMEEVASLLHVHEKAQSGQFDLIILDCAPTGETIRLISMPDIIDWYIEKMFSISLKGAGIFEPVLKSALAIPGQAVFKAIQTLFGGVTALQAQLIDPAITSIRVVMNPEKMVLKEALRSFTYFSLFGYNVDLVLLNRIVEETGDSELLQSMRTVQAGYISQAKTSFTPVPMKQIPLFVGEIVGLENLEKIAKATFSAQEDPTQVYFQEKIQEVHKLEGGEYLLKRRFPPFEIERFDLRKKGDELILTIGNVRRSIILPQTLAMLEPVKAEFRNGELQVRFR